jgi:hypothetical protein
MLIEVRRAMAEEVSRVLKFYAERRYGGGIRPEDALLLAEHDGELIGIVRLTTEESVVVHPAKAPTFLRLRLEKYRDRGDGNDYLIMRREGIQEASDSVRADTSRIS